MNNIVKLIKANRGLLRVRLKEGVKYYNLHKMKLKFFSRSQKYVL